ncbi:hypothetical protein FH972_024257 [Carpinus fangiana]|uniref:Uncharacterized protein n=1 Tax=Carpinus fangiana TaxID=176857 RepID=A0A5N6KXY8_9ROSI|nr:hypothetical protein FH972_024257 [Carpinus fangiana]
MAAATQTPPKREDIPTKPIDIPQKAQMPGSPERPPVSPITPVASFAQLASTHLPSAMPPAPPSTQTSTTAPPSSSSLQTPRSLNIPSQSTPTTTSPDQPQTQRQPQQPEPNYTAHPAPVSIAEEDNTDAQALRAALAVLQIQRDKSARDIKTLAQLKDAAARDPQRFVDEMLKGNLGHPAPAVEDPLAPTLEDDDSDDEDVDSDDKDSLPKFPTRQNIVRCPPVNWAKYHVLGDSLDKLHEEQRRRPNLGEPSVGEWTGREHVIAARYDPWQDPLQHPMQTRKGSKKPMG